MCVLSMQTSVVQVSELENEILQSRASQKNSKLNSNCILQHLMNNTVCFYCKTLINRVKDFPGAIIYESKNQDVVAGVSHA